MNKKEAVSTALGHLSNTESRIIRSASSDGGSVVAWTLKDRTPANVPYRNSFELNAFRSISYTVRIMHANHDQIIKKKVEKMLWAQIIKPVRSLWAFLVLIARKKDGQSRFASITEL